VINMVMYKLPTPELDTLKNLLKNRSVERLNRPQLESSYALRVMVEYYRREKKCKYVALLAMMDQMYDTSYESFRVLAKNLNAEATET